MTTPPKKNPKRNQITSQIRARLASEVLTNEAFVVAFDMLEKRYSDGFKLSDPVDKEAREIFFFKIRALADIRTALTAIIENGKIEEANEIRRRKLLDEKAD